jgi:predicted ATP-grasp superfamily ATP-dependent carboligase
MRTGESDGVRRPGAIVLGGAHGSLSIARSLGRRGIPVCFLTGEASLTSASRYVITKHWPTESDAGRVQYLIDLGNRNGYRGWTLFAASDNDVRLVSTHHAALQQMYRSTCADWSMLAHAYDKALSYELARRTNVDIPWTATANDRDEVARLDCPFPAILKPATKPERNAFTQAKAWAALDREALIRLYDEAASLVDAQSILIQERIPGTGETQFSYAALWWDGQPLATLVARRLRQFPIDFGLSSTYVETTEAPGVEEASTRLLAALRYRGLVEVEFKFDVRDLKYKLLDINPRCWTWHELGRTAGVDFPYLAWRASQGFEVQPCRARSGARWLYSSRDVAAAIMELRRNTLTFGAYLRSLGGAKAFAVFAMDDPLPAAVELPLLLSRLPLRNRLTSRSRQAVTAHCRN